MNVILYMATTPNGMIATERHETPWLQTEWNSFHDMVQRCGNIVIGRRTYEVMKESSEFETIGNPFVVVVASSAIDFDNAAGFACVASPQEALQVLATKGFTDVLITGGGELNGACMKEGFVDEVYLDIEPMFFGRGVPLFGSADFRSNLELIGTKAISKNEIQLQYRVIK